MASKRLRACVVGERNTTEGNRGPGKLNHNKIVDVQTVRLASRKLLDLYTIYMCCLVVYNLCVALLCTICVILLCILFWAHWYCKSLLYPMDGLETMVPSAFT